MSLKQSVSKAVIANLQNLRVQKSTSLYEFVKELSNVKETFNWSKTPWKAFSTFCEKELQIPSGTAYRYIYEFNLVNKFGYTQAEMTILLQTFSYSKLVLICKIIKQKHKVSSLINKYKKISTNDLALMGTSNRDTNEEAYGFSLPKSYANKYNGILESHGMGYGKNRRVNVRQAMMNFLDTI